jgi:hypothetical protein
MDPIHWIAHAVFLADWVTLAWVEAVMGQFYVAVIIAELIALRVSAAVRNQRPEGPPASGPE